MIINLTSNNVLKVMRSGFIERVGNDVVIKIPIKSLPEVPEGDVESVITDVLISRFELIKYVRAASEGDLISIEVGLSEGVKGLTKEPVLYSPMTVLMACIAAKVLSRTLVLENARLDGDRLTITLRAV